MASAEDDIEGQQLNKRESRAASLGVGFDRLFSKENMLFGADRKVTKVCTLSYISIDFFFFFS